jgi:hypothetical protein
MSNVMHITKLNKIIWYVSQYQCLQDMTDSLVNTGIVGTDFARDCAHEISHVYTDANLCGDDKEKAVINYVATHFAHSCMCDDCVNDNMWAIADVDWFHYTANSVLRTLTLQHIQHLLTSLQLRGDDYAHDVKALWRIVWMYEVMLKKHETAS